MKQREKELRIRQQFEQEQSDRRTENTSGKSFIAQGSGVNPFFVMQKERAAACTLRGEGDGTGGGGGGSGAGSAGGDGTGGGGGEQVSAEAALWEFLVSPTYFMIVV